MLTAKPTEHGTGITIYGSIIELESLYDYIHTVAESLDGNHELQTGKHQLLMNFAYEVRKAFQGSRIEQQFVTDNGLETYYGFSLVWIDVLVFMNVLRQQAFFSDSRIFQHMQNHLEKIIENALLEWHAEDAPGIISLIGKGIEIENKYIFLIYQHAHFTFISTIASRARFKEIPLIIDHFFNSSSPYHKEFLRKIDKSIKENNCQIQYLGLIDFPEILW